MPGESEQLHRSWIANAAAWCDAVREHRIASRAVTDAAILGAVLERSPRRVLDIGCGEGWLARALGSHGVAVTGVDASAPLIEAARALGGGEFLVRSYEEIAEDPSSLGAELDTIVANFSLLDDRGEELLRALEGQQLIVQTVHPMFVDGPYRDGWRTEAFTGFPGEWPESMPWYFRTIESWSRLFRSAGYRIEEIREPSASDRPIPASILFICRSHTADTTGL